MTDVTPANDETYLSAAEHALGLLGPDEVVSARLRENTDPSFAKLVAKVRSETGAWIGDLPDIIVSTELWSRIETSIGSHPAQTQNGSTRDDMQKTSAETAARNVGAWRVSALVAMAASLLLTIILGLQVQENRILDVALQRKPVLNENEAGRPANVAQISDAQGELVLGAVFYPSTGEMQLRTANFGDPVKVPELWVIDSTGKPHSLGIVDGGGRLVIQLPVELRQLLIDGATIAVTLEDPVGAPHPAPTGDILGTSRLTTL